MADDPSSIRNIAASLITTPDQERKPTREQAAAPETEAEPTTTGEPEDEIEGKRPSPDAGGDDGPEPAPDAGPDAADDGDDDPVYRVRIDGQDREVSLSELVSSYSGEGAIAKRLQEATEARNEATRARDVAVEQERAAARETIQYETETLRTQASQLAAVYQSYAEAILQPEVQMPDPNMRMTDPVGWLTAMEAYRQDQDRLHQQAAHMQEVVQEASRLEQQRVTEFARTEVQRMISEVPAMGNPQYRKAQAARVLEVGQAVGFSEAEIRQYATDRRVIYLAMLAAKGADDMIRVRQGGKPKAVEAKAPAPKPQAVVRARDGRFKANAGNMEAAKKTGRVEDVAKTMIVSGKQGKPQNFRARVL